MNLFCLNRRRERLNSLVRSKKKTPNKKPRASCSDEEDFGEEDEEYELEDVVLDPEEEKALALWSAPEQPRRTLADMIMEKIKEKELEMAREGMFSVALAPSAAGSHCCLSWRFR